MGLEKSPLLITLKMPPSVNSLYRSIGKRSILSKEGRIWYEYSIPEIQRQAGGWTCESSVSLTVCLTFPDRRRCDISNRIKALEDAITKAGVWTDDCLVDELIIRRHPVSKSSSGASVIIQPL
jgi:crossover junction endodeoxyribonuclease RusA